MKNQLPEFREDIVSGDWILSAPERLKRPDALISNKQKREITPLKNCPFEKPFDNVSEKTLLSYPNEKKWEIIVLENRYPAIRHMDRSPSLRRVGPYRVSDGAGHHDLVITKSHYLNFANLSKNLAFRVFESFRDRYLMLLSDKTLKYISIFHNWGALAGATIYHPHYQMISISVLPPDIQHSLEGAGNYFKRHKRCVHCTVIQWEKREKKRIVAENDFAVAFAPFFSRNPFEVRVFPKKHLPYFENTFDEDLRGVSEILQKILKFMEKNLSDPDYNFFIHTSPVKNKKKYGYYHWHIEIYPKLSTRAGFEFGTGMEINIVDPNLAAEILKRR